MSTPSLTVTLHDGRELAADDVGDPEGVPVIYVHGTPDSRLARHPDDGIAAGAKVRLVAVDRPGFGWSTVHDTATPTSFADDITTLADHLGIGSFSVLAWSAGAVWALGVAAAHPDRVDRVVVVAGLVPVEAYDDDDVRRAAGGARIGMVEAAAELGAAEAAAMIGPLLVPDPPTLDLALEQLESSHEVTTSRELASVAGATQQMALAMIDAVRTGTGGLERDVAVQLSPGGVTLTDVRCPVTLVYGELDTSCPPAFGHWFASHLPKASLRLVPGAGHACALTLWAELLETAAGPAA